MPVEYLTPRIEDHAVDVLAERSLHRAPSVPDLQIAELTVLHVDRDVELIADVTGQRVQRLDVD